MHRIVLPDLVRLLARVGARSIGDPALPVVLADLTDERGAAWRDGAVRATGDAAATVGLHVFNATGDRDSGGVLGTRRRKSGARAAEDGRPLLLKQPGQAWLRISMDVQADALARARRGGVAARAGAGAEARLLAYRLHDAGERCADAIVAGLARFADARSIDDVCALGVGDACMVEAEGTLSARVSLSWSALLSAAAPAVAEVSGRDAPVFLVEVPVQAAAALDVSITDGFSVAFARQRPDGDAAFRVVLRRRHHEERTAGISIGVEAGFADPDAVARLVPDVLAAVLAVPREALRELREATSLRALPARHRAVVAALAERLGIADSEPLMAIRERLEVLDARLAGRIDTLARTRASAVLEAEYRRLAADAVLLEAELSETALRRLHPALLALDAATVLADRGPGRAAVSLLHDRTIERLQGWSIEAWLGSWFELSSTQRRQDRFLERRRVDAEGDRTRHEYLGATRYTARANGWSTAYGATFEAVGDDQGGTACALQLWWEEGRRRTTPDGLARIVDDAVLWGLVAADGAPALHAWLETALAGVDRCRPRFELSLEDDALRAALSRLAGAGAADWASHAARALPRSARFAARLDCRARGATYGPVFAALGDAQGTALRRRIAAGLRGADPRLVARERDGEAPWTAWRVLRQSGLAERGPARAWRDWSEAAARLDAALAEAGARAAGDAFAALRQAFEQPFTLRTVAGLLAGVAGRAPRLSLAFERGGEARSLLVGA